MYFFLPAGHHRHFPREAAKGPADASFPPSPPRGAGDRGHQQCHPHPSQQLFRGLRESGEMHLLLRSYSLPAERIGKLRVAFAEHSLNQLSQSSLIPGRFRLAELPPLQPQPSSVRRSSCWLAPEARSEHFNSHIPAQQPARDVWQIRLLPLRLRNVRTAIAGSRNQFAKQEFSNSLWIKWSMASKAGDTKDEGLQWDLENKAFRLLQSPGTH